MADPKQGGTRMNLRWNRWVIAMWLVAVGSTEPGCSSHGSPGDLSGADAAEDPEEEVLAESCEHMREGPAREVEGAAWNDAAAPSVSEPHVRYDVAMRAVEGGHGGDLSFQVGQDGMLWIALSREVPLRVLRRTDGQPLEAEHEVTGSGLPCTEVARAVAFPVTVGTLVLRLGPTADPGSVSLVMEVEGGEHSHDHPAE